MSAALIASILGAYFLLLIGISWLTGRKSDGDSFFTGNKKSPWFLVAFGMIGASLSGVTFISIPGQVGGVQFQYMQMVLGYFLGYLVIAFVLLPIFYKFQVVSIYSYLNRRFGIYAHKTGAMIFIVSRVLGASVRLLMVANVLQLFIFDAWGIPFELTVIISLALIYVYTYKSGIKTIIWTDTLQTFVMLLAVGVMIYIIYHALNLGDVGVIKAVKESGYSQIFFFDDVNSKSYFWKMFIGGMFITIGMTGLDQDMMQKNLTCKSTGDAQKNMVVFAVILIFVNLVFLGLGALLHMYSVQTGVGSDEMGTDNLFPALALDNSTGLGIGILFLVGLIAAAYSSADSALTALTTSISYDLLNMEKKEDAAKKRTKTIVHIGVAILLLLVIIVLKHTTDKSAIDLLMTLAGFTYGPLIGLFFFGIISKREVRDKFIPMVCLVSVMICVLLWLFSAGGYAVGKDQPGIFGYYKIGVEMIVINALITFFLFFAFSKNKADNANIAYEN